MAEQFEQTELNDLLTRAQEIDHSSDHLLQSRPDLAELINAAEESGLPREAVMAALRERLAELSAAHEPGDPVFAQSPDGHWYPAIFDRQKGNRVDLRYFSGSIGSLEPSKIRPFDLAPGVKLQAYSSSYKMWVDAEIVRYNPDARSITVNYWYTEEVLPLERIRLKKEFQGFNLNLTGKTRALATLVGVALASAAASGLLGFIIGRLVSR